MFVFQNQDAWGINVASAIKPLLALLADEDAEVRRMAAFATGNVYKRRLDFAPHFEALRVLLNDHALYVPEAAAKALKKMSRGKHDIGPAVSELVRILAASDDYDQPRKEAASALLDYVKRSSEALRHVRRAIREKRFNLEQKEVKRFLEKLGAID